MKRKTKQLLLFFTLFFSVTIANAQEKQVTGTVKDINGAPVPNASYIVKGTTKGGITDANGHFSVSVKSSGAVLVFSSVNYESKEVPVDQNTTLDVILQPAVSSLNEVVVTALGIQKQKKSLGYAVQEVKGKTLVDARELNLVNDLSGKVAGLQITRSGNGPGGSSQITLRGNNSLTGLSQPLIVVDGVPMDNSTGR
ncbi:MAG: carboxypeptidase-like regulatory domain-containing protein, partial [Ginsengibacter sp.]